MKNYLKLMRVHHYIKNFLVFAAIIGSGELFTSKKFGQSLVAFVAFCAVSSIVYIINDIQDCEKDRQHPTKRNRPIASGKVSIQNAYLLLALLLIIVAIISWMNFNLLAILILASYILLNIAYSYGLKNMPIVDIFILVSGFLLRVLYGAVITNISVSDWLYLTVISISFFFALGKRRNELKRISSGKTRAVLKYYTEGFLDKVMYMFLGLANVFYALWTMDKQQSMSGNHLLVWTVPIVLLISLTYSMNVEGDSDGDPVEVLLHDKMLILLCLIYCLVMVIFLYVL